jgi:hypothetical protein
MFYPHQSKTTLTKTYNFGTKLEIRKMLYYPNTLQVYSYQCNFARGSPAAGGTNKEYHIIQSWDVTVVKPDAMLKQ